MKLFITFFILNMTVAAAVEPGSVGQKFTLDADRDHTFNALLLAIKDNWKIEAADAGAGTLRFSNNRFGKTQHDFSVLVGCSVAPCEYSVSSRAVAAKAKESGAMDVMNDLHDRSRRFLKAGLDQLVVKRESREYVSSSEPADVATSGPPATAVIRAQPEQIKIELLRRFSKAGYTVASDSTYQITFLRDQSVEPGILTYLLVGDAAPNRYKLKATFTLVPEDNGTVTVNTAAWGSVDSAGAYRPSEYVLTTAPGIRRDLQSVLDQIKAQLEAD